MLYFIIAFCIGFIIFLFWNQFSKTAIQNEVIEEPKPSYEEIRQKELEHNKNVLSTYISESLVAEKPLLPLEINVKYLPVDFKDLEYTVVDFETANKDPLSAISLGIAHFKGNLLLEVKEFRFSPIITYPWEFEHIHGISKEDAHRYAKFEAQWAEIEPHLNGRLLVAHYADFDMDILKATVSFIRQKLTNMRVACTFKLAKRFIPYEQSYSLENLCKSLNIPYWHHKAAHDAVSAGILFMNVIANGRVPSVVECAMRGKRISIKY